MGAISGFGIIALLIVYASACVITLGLLAAWNALRPPKFQQVLVGTALVGFAPWLIIGLIDLAGRANDPLMGYRIWLALSGAVFGYIPVLIPAVLWSLSRRGKDGHHSRTARKAGSLLVAYIVLVILVLPATFVSFVVFYSRDG